jgi:PEP-CTERM motif
LLGNVLVLLYGADLVEHETKKVIAALAGLLILLCAPVTPGAILPHNIVVNANNSWVGSIPRPFGLPPQPGPLPATITVDNTKTDKTGILDFSFVTGTKTWTENQITDLPLTTQLTFGASGELIDFVISLSDLSAFLILASSDTMNLGDGTTSISCNGCVDFSPAATETPLPGTLVLLFAAGLAGALMRRRKSVA